MIKATKDFDAVLFMREVRNILNEFTLQMTFEEHKEFIRRFLTDIEFANQMIEKYKMHLTYNMR